MSLLHCSREDYIVITLIILTCLGIIYQYGDIAIKDYINYKKYPSSRLSRYFLGKTKVFVFCLLAGYGYRLISTFYNPYKLLVLLLLILNYVTYRFRTYYKDINVFHKINQLEQRFTPSIKKIKKIQESILVDLFETEGEIKLITFDTLKEIEYNKPFDSDGSGVIQNTRINKDLPGFNSKSIMKANSYITKHQHDTDKILKCIKGRFFDSNTNKWIEQGDYLFTPKSTDKTCFKNWHDIKTGDEETELLTFIMPR